MGPHIQAELRSLDGIKGDAEFFTVGPARKSLRALVRDISPVTASPILQADLASMVSIPRHVPDLHRPDDARTLLEPVLELQRRSLVVGAMAFSMPRTVPVAVGGRIKGLPQRTLGVAIGVLGPHGVTVGQSHHVAALGTFLKAVVVRSDVVRDHLVPRARDLLAQHPAEAIAVGCEALHVATSE